MEEETRIELERAKMANYILEKENEILLENLCSLANEKRQLLAQLDRYHKSISYKLMRKIKKIIRRK